MVTYINGTQQRAQKQIRTSTVNVSLTKAQRHFKEERAVLQQVVLRKLDVPAPMQKYEPRYRHYTLHKKVLKIDSRPKCKVQYYKTFEENIRENHITLGLVMSF